MRKLFAFMGPGYMVSVGYMDPGNWATDLAGGAQFGYTLLFVIMLLGADSLAKGKVIPLQNKTAIILAIVLALETAYLLIFRSVPAGSVTNPEAAVNSVDWMRGLGGALFSQYLLPFEITSILLLVAMVGAIVLTKQEKGGRK
jgi:manganese transport protein